mgnify:CR=1 FL=1|tara:strand:+ start:10495 stop:11310 length:816 start_codon:yes stop_codon:yes gene_type:complete
MKYFNSMGEVEEHRKTNPDIPIWQIVCDTPHAKNIHLNPNIPVGVRDGYYPLAVAASVNEIYTLVNSYHIIGKEITVLEHHVEQLAKPLEYDNKYSHPKMKVNKDIIDPLRFCIDLDIFEKDLAGNTPDEIAKQKIDKIISILKKKSVLSEMQDFIVLSSPFDKQRKKYSFHIILAKKNLLVKNQYSFLKLLKEVKQQDSRIDKMFPGFITRVYKTGKYPMNQSKGRIFSCYTGIPETKTSDAFDSDRHFFEHTLMYAHDYHNDSEAYVLL